MLAALLALTVAISPTIADTITPVHEMKRLSVEKREALSKLVGAPLPKEPPVRTIIGRLPPKTATPRLGVALQSNARAFDEALRRAGLLREAPAPRVPRVPRD